MKLYLAVATLMLVLMAQCEAEEPTIEEHFANFQSRVVEFGKDVSSKAQDAYSQFENSEFVSSTKNWLTEQLEKMKQKFSSN